jgi:hypothetical protein
VHTDWLSNVAQKLDLSISEVAEVTVRHHIKPSPVVPKPKRILLKRIYFSGEKTGDGHSGEFSFCWDELTPGLWGILSERNLRGKSSIFGVVQWLLRGRSSSLRDDVRTWIQEAILTFLLDRDTYEITISNDDDIIGGLCRIDELGEAHEVVSFSNSFEFERAMSSFMMGQLSLEPVVVWTGNAPTEGGKRVAHEWPFLSGVMFIGTDYTSLLGDTFIPGLSVRLLQMYLGLPWVSTLTEAKASENSLKKDRDAANRKVAQEITSKEGRILEIESEIIEIKNRIEKTPSSQEVINEYTNASEQLKLLLGQIRQTENEVERSIRIREAAQAALRADKRELQSFVDAHAAGAVFRRLAPTICPRCEAKISHSKLQEEQESGACCICNEHIIGDDVADEKRAELSLRVKASEAADVQATKQLEMTSNFLGELESEKDKIQLKREQLEAHLDTFESRRELELQLVSAEAKLTEVRRNFVGEEYCDGKELKIITQLVKDVDSRVKAEQPDILKNVSDKILEYAKRFGLENYSLTQLQGGGQLRLERGGVQTCYSNVTLGEQLRLKVATILAIISVSHTSGVGRHPGLLMIDSPGSQEMVGPDLEGLMSGMAEVIKELPFLQVFVASVTSEIMLQYIDENKRVAAVGDNYLW